jgi:hypothetical protein
MRKSVKRNDLFGLWRVLGHGEKTDYFWCLCGCGTKRQVNRYSLTSGKSRSCGCARVKLNRKAREKHKIGKKCAERNAKKDPTKRGYKGHTRA